MTRKLTIVDHFDSFVHTIAGYCRALDIDCELIRHNDATLSKLRSADAILLSPGPGHPSEAANSLAAVAELPQTPILGVCLGHQIIGAAYGAAITRSEPVHGRTSAIHHNGTHAFADIASPTPLARYHSLVVTSPPSHLTVDAWTPDNTIMAISHSQRPHWGLQPHPEAVASQTGVRLLANFLEHAGFKINVANVKHLLRPAQSETNTRWTSDRQPADAVDQSIARQQPADFFSEPIQPAYPLPTSKKPL